MDDSGDENNDIDDDDVKHFQLSSLCLKSVKKFEMKNKQKTYLKFSSDLFTFATKANPWRLFLSDLRKSGEKLIPERNRIRLNDSLAQPSLV